MGAQCLQFGAEKENRRCAAPEEAIVEGLFAEAVARQRELALGTVPQSEGEHSNSLMQSRCDAPGGKTFDESLGVRSSAPVNDPRRFELATQRKVVIDFSVEDEHEAAVGRAHGLRAALRQFHDSEAPMAQRDAG